MTSSWRCHPSVGWFLLLTLTLTACAGQPQRLWLNAPGWSRAQLLDNTRVGDPVPVTFDDAGHMYILMISAGDRLSRLHLLALDDKAAVVWDRTFDEIELLRPHHPRIIWDGTALQIFWLSDRQLYNVQVDAGGQLHSRPRILSGKTNVGNYDVAQNARGAVTIWYAGSRHEPGLYALPPGDLGGEAVVVDAAGTRPDLQYDAAGALHAIWAQYPSGSGDKSFFYATSPDSSYPPGQGTVVAAPRAIGTTVLEGPRLGIDGQYAYVFWTRIFFSGPDAGTARTEYVYFPLGQPYSVSPARQLYVPHRYDLPYTTLPAGELESGERVSLGSGFRGGSTYITEVAANPTSEQELVITIHTRLAYLMQKQQSQVSAVFFQAGVPTGYQLLSFTPASSTHPAIFSDDAGRLYLTWLEKGDLPGWAVYYASTTPGLREALGGVTPDDAGRLTAEVIFGLLAGAALIPVALTWIVPSMIVFGLAGRLRGVEERLTSPGSMVSLVLALGVLWGIKLSVLPGILEYVPLSAWLPVIPSWLKSPFRLGVPLLIAGLAFLAAWNYAYRRVESSIFGFWVVYAVVDAILTMAVYGVLVYAVA
ncbi:MAG: hypothetical protein ACE5HA_16075 [Anaerolineae bacterium]